jgi:hypothetical protein
MSFLLDAQELKTGLVIFRRGDVKHRNWYCRIKLPQADRYKTVWLKTSDVDAAKERAFDEDADLRFRIKHDVPIFNRSFSAVAREFVAQQKDRRREPGLPALSLRLVAAALAAASIAFSLPAAATAASCASSGVGRDSFCEVDGARLHYVDWGGQGPAIVLLTGLGDTAHVFDDLAPRLAHGHHVVAITRRGYGRSVPATPDFSNAALVDDTLGLMDRLGIASAVVVGHSIAGGEPSTLGADHADRVRRLVYLDAAYDRTRALEITNGVPAGARPNPAVLQNPAGRLTGPSSSYRAGRAPSRPICASAPRPPGQRRCCAKTRSASRC